MAIRDRSPLAVERPHSSLLVYYVLQSLLLGPLFPVLLVPLYFRYHTLRYTFDDQGVTMRWGVLFRREISLTYTRLQDIHLASNIVERWLGLARIELQTASGSAKAEMTLEGLPEFAQVRDALYLKMRGASGRGPRPAEATTSPRVGGEGVEAALHAVADELAAVRRLLEQRQGPLSPGGSSPDAGARS